MDVFQLTPRITLFPVIHGSGDYALAVRRLMLDQSFDCLAVPLPASFQGAVEQAIEWLPTPTVVSEQGTGNLAQPWTPDNGNDEDDDDSSLDDPAICDVSYVPIDPCQAVIAALRIAAGEHMPTYFIDLETDEFQSYSMVLPDSYALKTVSPDRFAATVLPHLPPPPHQQACERIVYMADQLDQLSHRYERILMVCSILDWVWIRDAFRSEAPLPQPAEAAETQILQPEDQTLLFVLGELPFITGLYERARQELENDENLSVDGIKELLITARTEYRRDFRNSSRKISPHSLRTILKYLRNLTLMERRLTPDLYSLIVAAKQVVGDSYALHVAEQAAEYPYLRETPFERVTAGIDKWRLANGDVVHPISRLPGNPVQWRSCQLLPRHSQSDRHRWQMNWNPYSQCSWPPEDKRIEDFRSHVADKARLLMGMDLAKTKKFTTSIEDGIDMRETLRNWHSGDLYVKVMPPAQGRLDAVVMLFDSPADPRLYPWRTTWIAEHQNESTLVFFASDYQQEVVGPGIAMGVYGGALFLFPPVIIPDPWLDPRIDFATTLEERLLAAACIHSQNPQIALVSPLPPGAGWRKLASRFKKKWVHLPLSSFSQSTVHQLRMVHVLNGHQVRSFAADFIRRA